MVHSVHCMMGEALVSGEECSVEEQVERLFAVRMIYDDGDYDHNGDDDDY